MLMVLSPCFYLAWLLIAAATAHTISGQLDSSLLPLSLSDVSSTTVILRDLQYQALAETYLQQDGKFYLYNVPNSASYLLDIESVAFSFNGIFRVDIDANGVEVIHKVFYGHDSTTDLGPTLESPITITAMRNQFIAPRPAFNFLAILKSPMILMSLGSLVLVFVVPKIVENLDPEALEQLQEHQSQRNKAVDKVSNFDVASYIANKRTGEVAEGQ